MRRVALLVLLVVALGLGASAAWAGPVYMSSGSSDRSSWYNGGGSLLGYGGEFDVWGFNGLHSTSTASHNGQPGFRSFCLQIHQDVYEGQPYNLVLATETDHGEHVQLAPQVAYLFHQFNAGALNQYDYTYGTAGRRASATDLQAVIWYFQAQLGMTDGYGVVGYSWATMSQRARDWATEANTAVDGAWGHTLGGVKVMQLFAQNGTDGQDLITETPEPASLALLAIGALPVLPIVRRRRSLA